MIKVPLPDSPFQIASAAEVLPPKTVAEQLARFANDGDPASLKWINRLIQRGVSNRLFVDLFAEVEGIEATASIVPDMTTRKFRWSRRFRSESAIPSRRAAIAFLVIRIVNANLVNRLHRCAAEDCLNYFFGDRRSKWCSHTCGSRIRSREHRK